LLLSTAISPFAFAVTVTVNEPASTTTVNIVNAHPTTPTPTPTPTPTLLQQRTPDIVFGPDLLGWPLYLRGRCREHRPCCHFLRRRAFGHSHRWCRI
jgi:hypothetical protein